MTKSRSTLRFDQIAKNITDRVEPAEADTDVYVGLEHLDPESLKIRRWGKPTDVIGTKFRFKSGDIIFGRRRAYQRKLAVAEFEGICSAHAMVLRACEENVLPEFLPFFMQSDTFFERAMAISVGSLSPTINWKTLAQQEFPLPPKAEQRRIAEILWAAEYTLENWKVVIRQIEAARSTCRYSLFSNTQGWRKLALGALFEVQLGKMLSPKARRDISPRPYLGNANVQWGRFDLIDVKTMDFDEKEFKKFVLRPGDLLVCEGGEVGRAAIWRGEIEDCCYQKALHRLRPLTDTISSEIMLQFLFYAAEKGEFTRLTGHSTIAHLTAVKLKELSVPVPPRDLQLEMIEIFEQFELSIELAKRHLIKSKNLRKNLVEDLLYMRS